MSDTYIDEYEDRFSEIDSELDALRSSILEDNTTDDTPSIAKEEKEDRSSTLHNSELVTSLVEESVAEMSKVVKTLKKGSTSDPLPSATSNEGSTQTDEPAVTQNEQSTASKPAEKKSSLIYAIIPVIIAVLVGLKLSNNAVSVVDGSTGAASVQIPNSNNGRAIQYQESRKVERCRIVNGKKYCESDEQSRTATSDGSGAISTGQPRVFQQATFQKCRYANGRSHCESFHQQLADFSSDNLNNNEIQKFTVQRLMQEFREADVNRDSRVSKKEFQHYKQRYLKAYPEAAESSFASFGDFDHNRDGLITVDEHEKYYRDRHLL
jgi:hypothetical protein